MREILGTYTLNANGRHAVVLARKMGRDGGFFPFQYSGRMQAEARLAKLKDRDSWEVYRPASGRGYYIRKRKSACESCAGRGEIDGREGTCFQCKGAGLV